MQYSSRAPESLRVELKRALVPPSEPDLRDVHRETRDVFAGPLGQLRALRNRLLGSPACERKNTTLLCDVEGEDLSTAASDQFVIAQELRRTGFHSLSRPLYAAACALFARLHVPTNAAMVWDVGLGLQHDGLHQEATDFYAALKAEEGCSPFRPAALELGRRLAVAARGARPRPRCDGAGASLRGTAPPRAPAAWAARLPEFCPVLDMADGPYSADRFLSDFVVPSRPAVLRGLPPLAAPFRPQDDLLEGLSRGFGEELVTMFAFPSGAAAAAGGAAPPPLPAEVPVQLQELVALLQRNTSALGARVAGEHVNLDRELPRLADAVVGELRASGLAVLSKLPFRRVNLHLAPVGEGLEDSLHFDEHDSLLYQIECGREFFLFPPGDKEKLPYAEANDAQWMPQVLGEGSGQERVHWHSSRTLHVSRTSAHVDLEQWNATAAASEEAPALPRRCTVRAGDALFLPAYWHQQRRSFGGSGAGARCGCVEAAVDFWYRPIHTEPEAAEAAAATLARSAEL